MDTSNASLSRMERRRNSIFVDSQVLEYVGGTLIPPWMRTIFHRFPFPTDESSREKGNQKFPQPRFTAEDINARHATFAFPGRFNARIVNRKPGLYAASLCRRGSARARGVFRSNSSRGGEGLFYLGGTNVAATFTVNSPRLRRNSRVLFSDFLSIVCSLLRRGFQRNSQVSRHCRSPLESSGTGMNDDRVRREAFFRALAFQRWLLIFQLVSSDPHNDEENFISLPRCSISRLLISFHPTAAYYC